MRELAGLRARLERGVGADGSGPGGRDASDLRARAGELARLRGPVANNPDAAGDLEHLIEGIEALAAAGQADPDAMLDTIGDLERALQAAGDPRRAAVVAGREGGAPVEYRGAVETYFRARQLE